MLPHHQNAFIPPRGKEFPPGKTPPHPSFSEKKGKIKTEYYEICLYF